MFRERPHGSDLSLEVTALSRDALFREAARGLAFITGAYYGSRTGEEERAVFRGESDEECLVLLLEEILYRQSRDGKIRYPAVLHWTEGTLETVLTLYSPFLSGYGLPVKGVTWHGLSVSFNGDFWQGSLLFDL